MNYLTPEDVQARLGCGRRQAFRLMRLAGAWELGESLRISEEKWEQWVRQREEGTDSTDAEKRGGSAVTRLGSGPGLSETSKLRRLPKLENARNRWATL